MMIMIKKNCKTGYCRDLWKDLVINIRYIIQPKKLQEQNLMQ